MNRKLTLLIIISILSWTTYLSSQEQNNKEPKKRIDKNEKITQQDETTGKKDPKGRKLEPEILNKKKTGWYITPLPIVLYNTDNGLGYGLRIMLFNNGDKTDEYFNYTPYFYKISAQFFQTTLGWQYHFIESDMPYFMQTKIRLRVGFAYDELLNGNYFGQGPDSHTLENPNTGERYNTYNDYYYDFLLADKKKPYNYKYNKYTIFRPKGYLDSFYNITNDIKLFAGLEIKWTEVRSWEGREFDTDGEKNIESDMTLIDVDPKLQKFDQDGWINSIKFGIAFDTRDYEPDPKKGVFVDWTGQIAHQALGSELNFRRMSVGARTYLSPIKQLTFVGRMGYTTVAGDCPFHELGYFNFLLNVKEGLGNNRTLRGYKSQRFIGNTMTLSNAEVRFELVEVKPLGQRFVFKPLAFVDTGRVYNHGGDPFIKWEDYQVGYGGGLVLTWNQATVIHFYWGFSDEDSSFSMDVQHAID